MVIIIGFRGRLLAIQGIFIKAGLLPLDLYLPAAFGHGTECLGNHRDSTLPS